MLGSPGSFYVYALCDPRKPIAHGCGLPYEPFYIGKGCGNRAFKHFSDGKYESSYNPHKTRKIKKIKSETGRDAFLLFVRVDMLESDAFELEKALISQWGRVLNKTGVLVNITEGGSSVSPRALTAAAREKQSSKRRGVPLSENHKEKIRQKAKGRKHTQATREKIRNIRLDSNSPISEATREKLSAALKGKPKPVGFGEKVSKAKQGTLRPDVTESKSKVLSMYSIYGALLGTYANARKAMSETGVHYKSVSACCTGRRKTAWQENKLVTFRLGSEKSISPLELSSRGRHVCAPPIKQKH